MKYLLVTLSILTMFNSCSECKRCGVKTHYLSKIDTTKPYNVKSKYCMASVKKHISEGDSAIIKFSVFDRITGRKINDGLVKFNNNFLKANIINGEAVKKLPEGSYRIGVLTVLNNPLIIKSINLKSNTETHLICYLGGQLQQ